MARWGPGGPCGGGAGPPCCGGGGIGPCCPGGGTCPGGCKKQRILYGIYSYVHLTQVIRYCGKILNILF